MKHRILCLLTVALLFSGSAKATEPFVTFTPQPGCLPLHNAVLRYSANDDEGVLIALRNLQEDFRRVFGGASPNPIPAEAPTRSLIPADAPTRSLIPAEAPTRSLSKGGENCPLTTIVVGTLGRNAYIDGLRLTDLKGKREKFIITSRDSTIVIAGSDRRGTIYGIYELSRQIGVSPWYWWADVPVEQREEAYFVPGTYSDGEPAVAFRGLFLNDEAPCLTSWVKNTFGTNYGDHRFYEKVFELILRLKGNMLWPAMWSWAFYADDPENSSTAHRMGIIMGTSHHEPMGRNHQEYARHRNEWGPWNYNTNAERLNRFFREGIERLKDTEDMVTIGMRGDGDEAMSAEADTRLLKRIITNQRKIIRDVTKKPAEKTTQVWALYKEVQDYYDAGLEVPDDVMILISDDNWGDIRRVPVTEKERSRKGGWGIYYHVDYVGAPRNTKWLNVTQTQQMFEQLSLAYDYGIQRMWILNVGDLKPMEYPIQLFMDMAWNPKEYTLQQHSTDGRKNVIDHTRRFFSSVCGDSVATEAAAIYNQNCQYMARVTPEMLDARTYNVATGEWRQVADAYQRLETRALRLYEQVPEKARDAYRQLLLFPVQAMSNLYDLYYAQAMNHYLAQRHRPEANEWADRVAACFQRDSLLCLHYNKVMSHGKWDGMMTQRHIGYRSWNDDFARDQQPPTARVDDNGSEGGYRFTHSAGYVSMEAAHYYSAVSSSGTSWKVYPYYGRTLSGVALTPYTESTGEASLSYRFTLPADAPPTVRVHIVVKSTLDFLNVGGHEYTVSLDGSEAQRVNINKTLVDRQPYMYSEFYPTIARRIIEKEVELPVGRANDDGLHELTIHPCHPGIVFEKIVVDFGGYQPSYLFMDESECRR